MDDFLRYSDQIWDVMYKLGGGGQDFVTSGLSVLEFNTGMRIPELWPHIMDLVDTYDSRSGSLFQEVLNPVVIKKYGKNFNKALLGWIKLIKGADRNSIDMLGRTFIPAFESFCDNDQRQVTRFLRKMFAGADSQPEAANGIGVELAAVISWLSYRDRMSLYGSEIKKILVKISNSRDPQARHHDLKSLRKRLDSWEESTTPESFARYVTGFLPTPPGMIAQGDKAREVFNSNLQSGFYDAEDNRNPDLEYRIKEFVYYLDSSDQVNQEIKQALEGKRVRVVPAIITAEDDFVLGHHDRENNVIYLSEEVVSVLFESSPAVLKEYIWHELFEDPSADNAFHYKLIAEQQKRFRENYIHPLHSPAHDGADYIVENNDGKLKMAKGRLGFVIREAINSSLGIPPYLPPAGVDFSPRCVLHFAAGKETAKRMKNGDLLTEEVIYNITMYCEENTVDDRNLAKDVFEHLARLEQLMGAETFRKCWPRINNLILSSGKGAFDMLFYAVPALYSAAGSDFYVVLSDVLKITDSYYIKKNVLKPEELAKAIGELQQLPYYF